MKRIICILLFVSAFNMNIHAKGRPEEEGSRWTFGIEWGYVGTLHMYHHHNFFAPDGYRVDDKGGAFGYGGNAETYAHAGYDFSPEWNLSVYLGYEGILKYHKAIPVSLRLTRFFDTDVTADRWFSFADLGTGVCLKRPVQEILGGKIGGGYRLVLGGNASLDFLAALKMTYSHPQIIYDGVPIHMDRTNRNNILLTSLSVGMALNF